jgi:Transglutaminase-like superfamily
MLHALLLAVLLGAAPGSPAPADTAPVAPARSEAGNCAAPTITAVRTWRIRQTVRLNEVPAGAREVKLWAALPADGPWQRVLARRVLSAPTGWSLEAQPRTGGEMIFARSAADSQAPVEIVVETIVRREAPRFDLAAKVSGSIQPELFVDELRTDEPLMEVSDEVRLLADTACAGVRDPRRKVLLLLDAVANAADHYSKDASKPKCGRGAAEDCMAAGGGCCSDLHALFIACARSQRIPARFQMGYRVKPEMAGKEYDPGYRCWAEVYLPGSGWVPTDLVVADGAAPEQRAQHYGALDANRVWLWQGRGFELSPAHSGGPIHTMLVGWAEIDGVAVEVLPDHDGTPSQLSRTITFEEITDLAGAVVSGAAVAAFGETAFSGR